MKAISCFALATILSLLTGCGEGSKNSAKHIALFNGENLDGWVIENNGRFSVEDGVLKLNQGTGWLRSAKEYGDFVLTMEFRFMEPGANSGIFVRTGATSKKDESGYPDNGYQIQCIDMIEHQYPLAHLIPYGAPDFKSESNIEALKRVYRPTGEWQTMEVTCQGESMEIKLNGAVITTASSIKNLTGHIGIQGEKSLLEFRKIDLQQLP